MTSSGTSTSLEQRSSLLSRVLDSALSDFYRTRFAGIKIELPLKDEAAWAHLPLLSRDDISNTPFWDRVYAPRENMSVIRPTSGTSTAGILLTPRQGNRAVARRFEDAGVHITGALTFLNPHHLVEEGFRMDGVDIPVIGGDPLFPELSVRMAAQLPINLLLVYTYFIDRIISTLVSSGLAERISCIELIGERLSLPMQRRIRSVFPHAVCTIDYGASDTQGDFARGFLLPGHEGQEIEYESIPDYFLELLREDGTTTASPEEGEEGELVLTLLAPFGNAFPIIRYRIGDYVHVVRTIEPGHLVLSPLGRVESDKLKLSGGTLWPSEIERAILETFGPGFTGEYIFEVDDREEGGHIREGCTLFVPSAYLPRDNAASAQTFAEVLRVTPVRSYADGMRSGFYAPLRIQELTEDLPAGKRKRMRRTISR